MEKTFNDVAKEMIDLHERKDADYGNAFGSSFQEFDAICEGAGLQYAVGRMNDKMKRIKNLAFKDDLRVTDEAIEDTLVDLAAYALMTVVELKNRIR